MGCTWSNAIKEHVHHGDRATDDLPPDGPPPQSTLPTAAPRKEPPQFEMVKQLTKGPLDASDIQNFSLARCELRLVRKYAKAYIDSVYAEELYDNDDMESDDDDDDEAPGDMLIDNDNEQNNKIRDPIYEKQDFASFRKVTHTKTNNVRSLIYNAMKHNDLFGDNTEEEMLEIVDVFKPQFYRGGDSVITQGSSEGTDFYVVESGELSILKSFGGAGKGSEILNNVELGEYSTGSSFGETALIFGTYRATTIMATTDCKLWSLDCMDYISLISQLRHDQHIEKKSFLRTCVVRDRAFVDIFDEPQIEDLAIATKVYAYEKGDVILREGDIGDSFYIVKSGSVGAYKRGQVEKTITIGQKKAFGTTSLLQGVKSPCTYIAASRLMLYYLTKLDFEKIMGSFVDALDGQSVVRGTMRNTIETSMTMDRRYDLKLDELVTFNVLGQGAFGKVTLVQSIKNKKVFALKAQSKDFIIKRNKQDHIINEYLILKECNHPNILGIHCAMQDKCNLYFLIDLVPGGELYKHYLQYKKFPEDITRFYAASVVLAFEYLHHLQIAYRDLKPENVVLNKHGYAVLVDFGLAKEIVEGQSYTLAGTPDYLAPEILRRTGHDWSVDYWCLGIFIFELTNGRAPFNARNQQLIGRNILRGYKYVRVPSHFSSGLQDLIANLLVSEQSQRLGFSRNNGIQDIINHRWFAGYDWNGLKEPEEGDVPSIEPPIKPSLPSDIKTLGKKMGETPSAPESDWWPDIEQWCLPLPDGS